MCALANPLKKVHRKTDLRGSVDNIFNVACVDKPRQMKYNGSTQPRPKIRRVRRQIAHRLIKGKIEPFLNVVVHLRGHIKYLPQRQPRCHHLDTQMIVLIDENTDTRIPGDICQSVRLYLGKFLADEPLLNQNLALQCS